MPALLDQKFSYTKNDFLDFFLFKLSLNRKMIRNLRVVWIGIPLIYIALPFILRLFNAEAGASSLYPYAFVALLWFILYPLYKKWRFKKHYSRHIEQHIAPGLDEPTHVILDKLNVFLKDSKNEMKFSNETFHSLYEINGSFYILLKNSGGIILPKEQVETEKIRAVFKTLSEKWKIGYHVNDKWKWGLS